MTIYSLLENKAFYYFITYSPSIIVTISFQNDIVHILSTNQIFPQ